MFEVMVKIKLCGLIAVTWETGVKYSDQVSSISCVTGLEDISGHHRRSLNHGPSTTGPNQLREAGVTRNDRNWVSIQTQSAALS